MNRFATKLIALAAAAAFTATAASAEKLTIIHTNDTHSQIDPMSNGLAGALRRKVVVDSVRQADKNVLLIDAGDAVQGTLYFTLYGGEVEHKVMNLLRYDFAILGNHDFDNGIEALANNIRNDSATWITTNYDLRGSALDGLFVPYVIKEYDGKRIGFMGINLNPEGMISKRNYPGVEFLDILKAANSTAWSLKHNERADMVIAITHIGYDDPELTDDITLAANSEDIDIIIGGHSHTTVNPSDSESPSWLIKNLNGKEVLVTQTGYGGKNVGKIVIDIDSLGADYSLIAIDQRLDSRIDPEAAKVIEPYRAKVDSLMSIKVAKTARQLDCQQLANLLGDLMLTRGRELAGKDVDFGLINNGGIRNPFPKGTVSEGDIIMTLPFENSIRVIEVKGSDLLPTFNRMIDRGINGVSANVDAVYDPDTKQCTSITIDGKPLDPDRTYRLSTIDYLANGGDYLVWLKNGKTVAASPNILYKDVINMLRKSKKTLNPPAEPRIHP